MSAFDNNPGCAKCRHCGPIYRECWHTDNITIVRDAVSGPQQHPAKCDDANHMLSCKLFEPKQPETTSV